MTMVMLTCKKKETRIDKDDMNFWSQKRERDGLDESVKPVLEFASETIWGKECVRWNAAAPFVFLIYSQEKSGKRVNRFSIPG